MAFIHSGEIVAGLAFQTGYAINADPRLTESTLFSSRPGPIDRHCASLEHRLRKSITLFAEKIEEALEVMLAPPVVPLLARRLYEAGLVIQCLLPHGSMSHPEPSASYRRRLDRLLNVAHDRQISVDAYLHIVNGR